MSNLYSGSQEREEFAREEILPLLEEIENEIDGDGIKRNLKDHFFERLLNRHDGFLVIECMAHLRNNLRPPEERKVISMILDEWKEQTDVPDSYDTLGGVLRSLDLAPIYTCNALILQARRRRGKSGVKPKNAEAAPVSPTALPFCEIS